MILEDILLAHRPLEADYAFGFQLAHHGDIAVGFSLLVIMGVR
jgi:hypothetical protein